MEANQTQKPEPKTIAGELANITCTHDGKTTTASGWDENGPYSVTVCVRCRASYDDKTYTHRGVPTEETN